MSEADGPRPDGHEGEVARLAAGVAHDLGHLLSTVGLNLESLARRSDGAARARLGALHVQVEGAVALVRELAAVAAGDGPAQAGGPAEVVVDDLVAGLAALVAAAHHQVELRVEAGCPGVAARARPVDLRRCLLNLLVNAVAAEPGAGPVVVRTQLVELTGTEARTWPAGRRGRFVAVDVGGTGPGPTPDQLATALAGRGRGRGLPTTLALLDRCGGALQLVGTPPGEVFVGLRLPLA